MHTVIERRREGEYERYAAYRRFEEATDIAERLGYPIDHTLTHQIVGGRVYDAKQVRVADYTQKSLEVAPALFRGVNEFEVRRRAIEHDNTLLVEALASGELAGNALIEVSLVPEEVRDGIATIDGYRRDLMRSFIRVQYVEGDELKCRLFSLDGSHRVALETVGDFLGMNIARDRSSEAILAEPKVCTLSSDEVDQLSQMVKQLYDRELQKAVGGTWSAGSRFVNEADALSIVLQHQDLLTEHMDALAAIIADVRTPSSRKQMEEQQRRRLAAAIDVRLNGGSASSLGEASVSSQLDSGQYGGECALGTTTSEQMGLSQGKQNTLGEEIWMTCPFCGLATYGDPCASRIVCNKCTAEVRNGRVVSKGIGRHAALQRSEPEVKPLAQVRRVNQEPRKSTRVQDLYGERAVVRREITVGGERRLVVDKHTGAVIAQL